LPDSKTARDVDFASAEDTLNQAVREDNDAISVEAGTILSFVLVEKQIHNAEKARRRLQLSLQWLDKQPLHLNQDRN
jgi:hypothetical protein